MTRMTDVERCVGRRADFHLYWRKPSGKLFVDAMWGRTPEEVTALFLGFAKELKWKVRVVRVVAVK